jgi:hypothetical protein
VGSKKKVIWPVHGSPPRSVSFGLSENTRMNLSLNTQASADPELSASLNPNWPSNAPWRGNTAYGGAFAYGTLQYAEHLGDSGSVVGTIGGHNGYWGNEVVRFDIASRMFAHLSDPYSSASHPGQFFAKPNEGHGDKFNGELHIDALYNTDQTQPCSFHAYWSNIVLPPDSETGVGAKGGLITSIRAARYLNGVDSANHSHRTHIFDLAQSNRATANWARYSTNLFENGADRASYGWAAYDPTRKKVYAGLRGSFYNAVNVFNCVTRQWETALTLSENVAMFFHPGWHWRANPDYLIVFGTGNAVQPYLRLIHIPTGQVYTPSQTGTYPQLRGGYDFVQSSNKIAVYEGGNTFDNAAGTGFPDRVWVLTPPSVTNASAFTTGTWTWTYETISGPTPPIQTANIEHGGRFVWADKVKCFIWWANGVDNVQAWKVRGFN